MCQEWVVENLIQILNVFSQDIPNHPQGQSSMYPKLLAHRGESYGGANAINLVSVQVFGADPISYFTGPILSMLA